MYVQRIFDLCMNIAGGRRQYGSIVHTPGKYFNYTCSFACYGYKQIYLLECAIDLFDHTTYIVFRRR